MRALTIDVEDYHSIVARDKLGIELPVSGYIDREVEHLIGLLDELGVRATCFVVGRVAKERPHIVRMIAEQGHEIASHGFQHLLMHQLGPRSFKEDLRNSIDIIQGVTGAPVHGFRAPAFSLGEQHHWAFEVMAELGIKYDSSVRLVWPFGCRAGQKLISAARAAGIHEYPGLAMGYGRYGIPLEGGGGLRLVPESISRWGVRRVRQAGLSGPIYVHPYDFATSNEMKWPDASLPRRFRLAWFNWIQHRGRSKVAPRLYRAIWNRRSDFENSFQSASPSQI